MNTTHITYDCPVPPWVVLAGAALLLAIIAVFLTKDLAAIRRTSRRRAMVIGLLTVFGLILLTGIALSPRMVRTWRDPHKPLVPILVDGSRSMLFADAYQGSAAAWIARHTRRDSGGTGSLLPVSGGAALAGKLPVPPATAADSGCPTRQQIVQWLLDDGGGQPAGGGKAGWLAQLGEKFDLRGWRFAGGGSTPELASSELSTLPLAAGGGKQPSPVKFEVDPDGYSTPLGDALDRIANQGAGGAAGSSGERPRGIILISDGAWNTGKAPDEVARTLGQLGVPIYVIGVGDPNPPRDVAVLAVKGPKRLFLGDELTLTAEIVTSGIGAVRIPVQLLINGTVADTKEIVAASGSAAGAGGNRPITVNFTCVPDRPGIADYTVRVPEQPGERDVANNQASATVDVDERKIRVLMVDSEPRWQFRFLCNAMKIDPAVTLKICLLRPGVGPTAADGYITELPADKKALADYDVVILGDVERSKLPGDFIKEVAEMVRHRSAALLVMAGRKGYYRQLVSTPIGEILPVTLQDSFSEGFASHGGAPFSPELTELGRTHLLTRLASNTGENEGIWGGLPPLRWSAPVSGLAVGADSLLAHPNRLAGAAKLPLLAVQQVGAGKVLFCGMDETWRWRQEVGDKYFYKFWAQTVRWMVKKPFTGGDEEANKARLSMDRTESDIGEKVQVEAYCLGPDGYPLTAGQVSLRVEAVGPDGNPLPGEKSEQIVMRPAPGGWGIYRGDVSPGKAGQYIIRPIVSAYGEQPLKSSVKLTVTRANLERNMLAQDRASLAAIAQASGGEFIQFDGVDGEGSKLVESLIARAESSLQTVEFSPTRHWAYYLIVVLVLSALWLIRKRSGLA